jgi:putative colanic acid biosynthesis acetyltransferase WcaF
MHEVEKRNRSPFALRQRLARLLWNAVWFGLFLPSPRPCFGWRRFLLRTFGAKIAGSARVYPGAKIWAPWNLVIGESVGVADGATLYSQDVITLGDYVTVSQEAYLCTGSHDYNQLSMPLWTAPISVGRNSWVAARAFVHPGVNVGDDAVVGACAVVTKDVAPRAIVAGNPARVVGAKQ